MHCIIYLGLIKNEKTPMTYRRLNPDREGPILYHNGLNQINSLFLMLLCKASITAIDIKFITNLNYQSQNSNTK